MTYARCSARAEGRLRPRFSDDAGSDGVPPLGRRVGIVHLQRADGLLDALRNRDPITGANRMVQHIATARQALEKAFAG